MWHDVVTWLAVASSVSLQLSTMPTVLAWVWGRPVREDPLQFVVMLVEAAVGLGFSWYLGAASAIAVRATAIVFSGTALVCLLVYADAGVRATAAMQLRTALVLAMVLVLSSLFAADVGLTPMQVLGSAATALGIASSSSPLAIAGRVIYTRDASSMMPALALATLVSCCSWLAWAVYVAEDPFTTVSSGTGAAVGALQLLLIVLYHPAVGCARAGADDPAEKAKQE